MESGLTLDRQGTFPIKYIIFCVLLNLKIRTLSSVHIREVPLYVQLVQTVLQVS